MVPGLDEVTHLVVNLPHRRDRWDGLLDVFELAGLPEPIHVPAVSGLEVPPDVLGRFSRPNISRGSSTFANACATAISHRKAMITAVNMGVPYACIWEDDAWPHPNILLRWKKAMAPLTADRWDLLSVGCTHKKAPSPVVDGLVRVVAANTATGYLLAPGALREAVDLLSPTESGRLEPVEDWDQAWRLFSDRGSHYAPDPNLAVQRPSHSDITGRKVSPNTARFTGWNGPPLEEWLR